MSLLPFYSELIREASTETLVDIVRRSHVRIDDAIERAEALQAEIDAHHGDGDFVAQYHRVQRRSHCSDVEETYACVLLDVEAELNRRANPEPDEDE